VGPDEVTLQGVGELHEGVWDTRGFTFRVLLIPYGPFTEVARTSEVMLPRVSLLRALEFHSLSLGCLGSASVLELFELLLRKCRIFLQNLGQGFLSLNSSFHPPFPGGQIIVEHAHGVIVNLFHLRIIPRLFYVIIPVGELESVVQLRQEQLRQMFVTP